MQSTNNSDTTNTIFQINVRFSKLGPLSIRSDYFTGHCFHKKQNGLRYTVATCLCLYWKTKILFCGWLAKFFKCSNKIKNSYFYQKKAWV